MPSRADPTSESSSRDICPEVTERADCQREQRRERKKERKREREREKEGRRKAKLREEGGSRYTFHLRRARVTEWSEVRKDLPVGNLTRS